MPLLGLVFTKAITQGRLALLRRIAGKDGAIK